MMPINVFLSAGRTSTPEQEAFVSAIEDYMKVNGLTPLTVGRNYIKNQQPLRSVEECMRTCSGTIVVAFERTHISQGIEKPGSAHAEKLRACGLPTVWNQIEATMAYCFGHPLLVLVQQGLRGDGLLEKGYDWYVKWVNLDKSALNEREFVGLVADWKTRVEAFDKKKATNSPFGAVQPVAPAELTMIQLLSALKPTQFWSVLTAIAAVLSGVATAAYKLGSLGLGH